MALSCLEVCSIPEQSLEIFRELSSTGVPRVHCDKKTNCRHQNNLFALEDKAFLLVFDSILYRLDLHCHH